MKKILISSIVMLLCIVLVASFCSVAFAGSDFDFGSAIGKVDEKEDDSGAGDATRNITGALLNVFRIVAVGVAMIMLVVVAIKYMSAAPEGKAEIKKHAVIYVVGAIVLFASAGILSIIQNFATSNIKASGNQA